jgi:hypothetical protein
MDTILDGANKKTTNKASPSTSSSKEHIHEKAYYRGYRDFLHGKLEDPYRKHSLLSKEWQRGQNAAYFVNLKFLLNGTLFRKPFNRKKVVSQSNANKLPKKGSS